MEIPREQRVSHSEVESWLSCKRKHYYGYLRSLERVTTSDALSRGTLGHDLLDKAYKAKFADPDLDMEDFIRTELMNIMIEQSASQETINLLQRAFKAFFALKPFEGVEILASEYECVAQLDEGLYYPFLVDLIYRDHRGPKTRIVVVDHKFTKDFYKPWDLELLPQIPKYIAALRHAGMPADEGAYSIFRTGFGKSATDEDVYRLQPFSPSEARLENVMREQVTASRAIQAVKRLSPEEQDRQALRVANKMVCNNCSFRQLCSAELNGHAAELLLRSAYRVKEDRVFVTTPSEEDDA